MSVIEEVQVPPTDTADADPVIGPATEGLGDYLVNVEKKLTDLDAFKRVRDEAYQIVRRCRRFGGADGSRTGLVIGYVQSGKTMSMTAVASVARDNGCRIVILLAGVTTNLLRQNATRFRDTLRGAASGGEHWLIINSEDGKNRETDSQTLKQAVEEWRDKSIPEDSQRTLFFAVLKHHKHLEWLRSILLAVDLRGIPALILDDEADQAGLNAKPNAEEGSTTYVEIGRVRNALPHHTYLQYTATPQAPLLISIDDILSPEFAELVEPGAGYAGGDTFFGAVASRQYIKTIPESDRFAPGEPPTTPPDSLSEALAVFFVGCAVARERKKPRPRSMLVHPSQRVADQKVFLDWVTAIVKRWSGTLSDPKDGDHQDTLDELKAGYDELAKTDSSLPPFASLIQPLLLSLRRVAVKIVNSDDGSEVDWANAEEHILVGGEKLNRGYTVEGLTVTYMPRDAGGWNADTLQQRARFFGYKQSYLSLCRLYLHPDVATAYREYVVHEKHIRKQLAEYRGRPLRAWRRAFFLDRKMQPTRRNVLVDPLFKVRSTQEWFVQRYPHIDPGVAAQNSKLIEDFKKLISLTKSKTFYDHADADVLLKTVFESLLASYRAPQESSAWYAQLVYLADRLDGQPKQMMTVIDMYPQPRERTPEDNTGAVTLMQGRTPGTGYPGDRDMSSPVQPTLQIHTVRNTKTKLVAPALALRIPTKLSDIAVQETSR